MTRIFDSADSTTRSDSSRDTINSVWNTQLTPNDYLELGQNQTLDATAVIDDQGITFGSPYGDSAFDSLPGYEQITVMPDSAPEEISVMPEPAPEQITVMPEPAPEQLTVMPEPAPEQLAVMPEAVPEQLTVMPEPAPEQLTVMPEAVPEQLTVMPEPAPEQLTVMPEAVPEQLTIMPEPAPEQITVMPNSVPEGQYAAPGLESRYPNSAKEQPRTVAPINSWWVPEDLAEHARSIATGGKEGDTRAARVMQPLPWGLEVLSPRRLAQVIRDVAYAADRERSIPQMIRTAGAATAPADANATPKPAPAPRRPK